MQFKNEELWNQGLANNQDSYGSCIYRYAASWATLMEEKMATGAKLTDFAKEMSHQADVEGITGFMYGAAASILSETWIHGEELRRWHNLDSQIRDEGEKANEEGGVLNPALLNISKTPSL